MEEARENQFFERLRATLDAGGYPKQERLIDRLLEQGYASTEIIAAVIHLAGAAPEIPNSNGSLRSQIPNPEIPTERSDRYDNPKKISNPKIPNSKKRWEGHSDFGRDEEGASDEWQGGGHERHEERERTAGRGQKQKYERPARTGREAGFVTLFFSVGRKQLVTPADIVGKIAGVTRLPADVVGAIDIHQRHTFADVREEHAAAIIEKVNGVRVRGEAVRVALAEAEKN